MHNILSILHLKPTFSILHTNFYKTPMSIYLFYTFIQQNIHFFYHFLLLSFTTPLSHRPTLPHRPRPNTQRKVAVVFVDVRAPLLSSASGSGGSVIKMARFLDRPSCLVRRPKPSLFVVNFLYFLFGW